MKKIKKLQKRLKQTNKAVETFINQITKNYKTMRNKIKKIWLLCAAILCTLCIAMNSCNVTRTITTQSQYFTKGDTTCTIVTKTIETYDATKKGVNL